MFCKVCGNSVEDVMFCEDGICLRCDGMSEVLSEPMSVEEARREGLTVVDEDWFDSEVEEEEGVNESYI
jgi:hypothetical protein